MDGWIEIPVHIDLLAVFPQREIGDRRLDSHRVRGEGIVGEIRREFDFDMRLVRGPVSCGDVIDRQRTRRAEREDFRIRERAAGVGVVDVFDDQIVGGTDGKRIAGRRADRCRRRDRLVFLLDPNRDFRRKFFPRGAVLEPQAFGGIVEADRVIELQRHDRSRVELVAFVIPARNFERIAGEFDAPCPDRQGGSAQCLQILAKPQAVSLARNSRARDLPVAFRR